MTALQDIETQQRGFVIVGYNMGSQRVLDRKAAGAIQTTRRMLPMRVAAMHYCYDDWNMRPMMTVAMMIMGSHNRVRCRAHYGTGVLVVGFQFSVYNVVQELGTLAFGFIGPKILSIVSRLLFDVLMFLVKVLIKRIDINS